MSERVDMHPAAPEDGLPARAVVTAPADERRTRLGWVDATRGYCVAAVVLYHVVLWHYGVGGAAVEPVAKSFWGFVNATLGSVRMPVLLAVSGLVLSRQVRAGLARSTTWFRAANNYYLYVVWLGVYAGFYALVTPGYLPHRVDGFGVLVQLFVPGTTLWYVFALAVYIVVLAALHRVPPWIVLVALVVLSTVFHAVRDAMWMKIPELFVFFAIGVYFSPAIRRLAERATLWRLGLAFLAAVCVTGLGRFADGHVTDALLFVARGVAFMVLAVLLVVIAVRWPPVERLGAALGRRTLAVYVMHPLWIAGLTIVALGPGRSVVSALLRSPAAMLYPLVLTVLIIVASIVTQLLAERARLAFLFEMPSRGRAWFGRA